MIASRRSTIALIALLAACGGSEKQDEKAPPEEESDAIAVDWSALPAEALEVDGWSFKDCGDEYWPALCATHPELGAGRVSALQYAIETMPEFRAEVEANGAAAALQWFAEYTVNLVREDRPLGCPGSEMIHIHYEPGTVDSHPAMAFGFELLKGGVPVEHVRVYNVFDGDTLFSISITGVDPDDGCFEPEGDFEVPGAADFEPIFHRLMKGSTNLRGLGWKSPPAG
ncbi:hypothetical protein [Vulgatibacter sp.]|uniref:hypothetical protein n=1 Tax=Vulgatibacter sp. TaxID=1971226 RepID=UPI0035688109